MLQSIELARIHQAELLREAEAHRLAQQVKNGGEIFSLQDTLEKRAHLLLGGVIFDISQYENSQGEGGIVSIALGGALWGGLVGAAGGSIDRLIRRRRAASMENWMVAGALSGAALTSTIRIFFSRG